MNDMASKIKYEKILNGLTHRLRDLNEYPRYLTCSCWNKWFGMQNWIIKEIYIMGK